MSAKMAYLKQFELMEWVILIQHGEGIQYCDEGCLIALYFGGEGDGRNEGD